MITAVDTELGVLDELAREFAARELVATREESDHYPNGPTFEGALRKALAAGFFSVMLPEELDGAGKDVGALCLLLERISRVDASFAAVIFADCLAKEVIYRSRGFEKQRDLFNTAGEYGGSLFAFPAYQDTGEKLGLSAVREAEGYTIKGTIEYVVLAGLAANAVLPATVAGSEGYSYFIVDMRSHGVTAGEPVLSLGLHACPAADLVLDGARGVLLGKEGEGSEYFDRAADRMSAAVASMEAGVIRASFDTALDYAQTRRQGGREIVDWTEVRRLLAGMSLKVKVSGMLVGEACRAAEEKEPGWQMGTRAAALTTGRMACDATADGIQLLGGNGYMEEYGQEKRFRDAEQIQSLLGMVPVREQDFIRRIIDGDSL